ncbi:hypothetical protein SAMN04488057_10293 [Cyclobacterium lianum]|uniref:DUF3352 domain-containing protein n=1 Tax=Cyclobacterium lianum TaxID=388280 RepID=A0A1M7JNC4_9BACT|nr:hypothetical protein [Cyclobacterium lianum]SHM54476.1 hypothetical protein SAMN04488057_10293 [Cyclobacterium lianum]
MNQIKSLLVILVILVLGGAAFLFYRSGFLLNRLEGSEVISPDAVFIYETRDPVGMWNTIVGQPIWEKLQQLPVIAEMESRLIHLDSITGKSGALDKYLKGQQFKLSMHPLGKEDFGFLITVAFNDRAFLDFVQDFQRDKDGQADPVKVRTYSGVNLFELSLDKGERTFTYAIIDNVLMGSYTSFLVEEGIRYAKSTELRSFKQTYTHLFQSESQVGSQGMVRLSGDGLSDFINQLSSEKNNKLVQDLNANNYSATLVPAFLDEGLSISGKLFVNGQEKKVFSGYEDHGNLPFASLISKRAALLYLYLFPDFQFYRRIPNTSFSPDPLLADQLAESVAIQNFVSTLSGNAALVLEEGILEERPDQILLLDTKDAESSFSHLADYNLEWNQEDYSKNYRDYFLGHEIILMDINEFPAHVFDGNFAGFPKCYLAVAEGQLILANSLKTMKNYLEDLYYDNTWGKSVLMSKLLKEGQGKEAPVQIYLNNDRFFPALIRSSQPAWSPVFQKYASVFRSFEFLKIYLKDEGDIEIQIAITPEERSSNGQLMLKESRSILFDKKLIYGPAGLENFNDKSTDFLLQDEDLFIHLVTAEGERVFSERIPEDIITDVFQIDYYKNGKLQLVFATQNLIYALDRYGNLLPGFPIHFEEGRDITYLNVLDYDNNRDYRFFVADAEGNLFVYSGSGELLQEWDPRQSTDGPLAVMPAHHRVPGLGDFMVAMHTNGKLRFFNRRGQDKEGGNIVLGESLSTDYGIEEGREEGLSKIVTVNDAGEVVKVNFKGELTYRNQLLRPDRNTRFDLVNDQIGTDFVWVIREYNELKVLNPDESLLFDTNIISEQLDYRYFSFGPANKIFVVLDRTQDFAYLYNYRGKLINQKPISVSENLWISFSGSRNEYTLVTVYENQLQEYKIPF